jgi:hypothetical protein
MGSEASIAAARAGGRFEEDGAIEKPRSALATAGAFAL